MRASGGANVWTLIGGAALAGLIAGSAFLFRQFETGDVRSAVITLGVMTLLGLVLWLAYRASKTSEEVAQLQAADAREAEYAHWLAADVDRMALRVRMSWKGWLMLAAGLALFAVIGWVAWQGDKTAAAALFFGVAGLVALGAVRGVVRGGLLVIGPDGVDDRRRFGLIPWDAVKGAHLSYTEARHMTIPRLWLDVGDSAPFEAAQPRLLRWLNKLDFPMPGMLEVPLNLTDQPPTRVLAAVRRGNAQSAPPDAFFDAGLSYQIDREFARIKALSDATLEEARAVEGMPHGAAKIAAEEAWRRKSEERLALVETITARRTGRAGKTSVGARRRAPWSSSASG